MIFIREKGNVLDDFNKGDVKIFINIINDTCFQREGMDLIFNKDISLKDALCGFTFEIDYLDDRIFKIDNHNGNVISSNYKKTIKNLGMVRDEIKGNLIICFNVLFPKKLSKDIIEKLESIL
jgi:DnaJ family protein A protein 2